MREHDKVCFRAAIAMASAIAATTAFAHANYTIADAGAELTISVDPAGTAIDTIRLNDGRTWFYRVR